jgi:hypothetical protein
MPNSVIHQGMVVVVVVVVKRMKQERLKRC